MVLKDTNKCTLHYGTSINIGSDSRGESKKGLRVYK